MVFYQIFQNIFISDLQIFTYIYISVCLLLSYIIIVIVICFLLCAFPFPFPIPFIRTLKIIVQCLTRLLGEANGGCHS